MTLEELFCDLYDKYSKDFNWYMIPFTQADGVFVAELNKEIGQDHLSLIHIFTSTPTKMCSACTPSTSTI